MKTLFVMAICTVAMLSDATSRKFETAAHQTLSAPTFYIAIDGSPTVPDLISFRGASNLPVGGQIAISIAEFDGDGWKDFSGDVCATIDEHGFLKGETRPKKGMKFGRNVILRASFAPYLCKQPESVLRIVGKKGQYLAGVGDADPHELAGLSNNPQLYQVSGWNYGLTAIARVQ